MIGSGKHVSDQEWGVIGPALLTHHVQGLGIENLAEPIDIDSPMYGLLSNLLFEEGLIVSDLVTSRTVGLHLYNSGLKEK